MHVAAKGKGFPTPQNKKITCPHTARASHPSVVVAISCLQEYLEIYNSSKPRRNDENGPDLSAPTKSKGLFRKHFLSRTALPGALNNQPGQKKHYHKVPKCHQFAVRQLGVLFCLCGSMKHQKTMSTNIRALNCLQNLVSRP